MGFKKLSPSYVSSSSTARRQPIPTNAIIDPKLNSLTQNFKNAKQNADLYAIDPSKTMASVITTLQNSSIYSAANPNTGTSGGSNSTAAGTIGIIAPLQVTNLVATSYNNLGITLTFDFDMNDSANSSFTHLGFKVYNPTSSSYIDLQTLPASSLNSSSSSQTLLVPISMLFYTGLDVVTHFTKIEVATYSIGLTNDYVEATLPAYVSNLVAPIIEIGQGVASYTVHVTNLTAVKSSGAGTIIIEEFISTDTLTQVQAEDVAHTSVWRQAGPPTTSEYTGFLAADGSHRWVRAYAASSDGGHSLYSNYVDVTPQAINPSNTVAPDIWTTASASWSGDDISVTWTAPSTNAGASVKVKVIPWIDGSASNSLYAYYYHLIGGTEISFLIKSLDLYGQFGTYYTKFTVIISALSAQGIESASSLTTTGITRSNPLADIYPIVGTPNVNSPTGKFIVTPITNGYVVEFDLPVGAKNLEVYEKTSAWTTIPTDDSNMIYKGLSPATVITSDANPRYIIVRFYDLYDNASHFSMEYTGQASGVLISPIDIGQNSLISNPIKIATDGSIFSGAGDHTVYPQVYFNKDGLFASDSSGSYTTQIINSASTGAPTFITKRAQIADWSITDYAIESTLITGITKYTGLSASNTNYAFWAGADSSKNSDGTAKFSVSPLGAVVANKITINGDGTGGNLIYAGGGAFTVTQTGALTATSANISGSLNVSSSSNFNSNINMGSYGILSALGKDANGNTSTQTTGSSVQIRGGGFTDLNGNVILGGLFAYDKSHALTTWIVANPIDFKADYYIAGNSTKQTRNGVNNGSWTFQTKGAIFGDSESKGWLITNNTLQSGNGVINLDSEKSLITITSANNPLYGVKIYGSSTTTGDPAITVGSFDGETFKVYHSGKFESKDATITGILKSSNTKTNDSTTAGYYFDNSTGSFIAGSTTSYIKYDGTSKITIQAGGSRSSTELGYTGSGFIEATSTQLTLKGLPIQGNTLTLQDNSTMSILDQSYASYANVSGFGPYPRQRTLVEDPVNGTIKAGFGIYYGTGSFTPSSGGYVGDIWVVY